MGVMPLPPPNATTSPSSGREVEGARRRGHVDGVARRRAWSFIQFETAPSGTRLTVTWSSSSTSGDDDIE